MLLCFSSFTTSSRFISVCFCLLSTVQIHNITSLQVLRHLRLPHIQLYIHSAGSRPAQVSLHPFSLGGGISCIINSASPKMKGGKGAGGRMLKSRRRRKGIVCRSDYRRVESKCVVSLRVRRGREGESVAVMLIYSLWVPEV